MGNASSQTRRQWDWEFKNGRANIVFRPHNTRPSQPKKPLFKKPAPNNYDWWIFNPDPPQKTPRKNNKTRKNKKVN